MLQYALYWAGFEWFGGTTENRRGWWGPWRRITGRKLLQLWCPWKPRPKIGAQDLWPIWRSLLVGPLPFTSPVKSRPCSLKASARPQTFSAPSRSLQGGSKRPMIPCLAAASQASWKTLPLRPPASMQLYVSVAVTYATMSLSLFAKSSPCYV